jgi:hypothetical protein
MFGKRLILLMIVLLGISLVPGMGSAPGRAAKASGGPISFRGNIVEFYEDTVTENGNVKYYVMNLKAEVETNSGDTFDLIYSGWEPSATPASDWRQWHGNVENSSWDFDADHTFEATGQMNGTQWFVFPPGLDGGTPTRGRLVGVFDITGGDWEGKNIVGGRASFNFSMEKDEYFTNYCSPEYPCNETVSGTIKGTLRIVTAEAAPPVPTPTPVPPLDTDTLLLLHFDEPAGTTLFQDSSQYKHHACCHGPVCPTKAERGLNFNGQDNYIMSSASIQGLSSFTLVGWFYARSYEHAGKHPLVFFAPGSDCPRAALRIGGGYTEGPVLFVADTDNCAPQQVVSASGVPALNQWHHIAAVFDSDSDRHAIYINGERVAENEYPIGPIPDTTPGHPIYIGVNYSPRPYDQRWWDGYIDEVALYGRALSPSEVKDLYENSNR